MHEQKLTELKTDAESFDYVAFDAALAEAHKNMDKIIERIDKHNAYLQQVLRDHQNANNRDT